MADNLTVQPDHGSTTEEILSFDELGGGVLVQRVKIQHGADGTATDTSGANPLPVTGTVAIAGTVPVTGTMAISGTVPISAASAVPVSLSAPVELAAASEVELSGEALERLADILLVLRTLLSNAGTPDVAGRLRVNVETGSVAVSSGTITTVTTLTTLANLAAIGGFNTQGVVPSIENALAVQHRNRIVVT